MIGPRPTVGRTVHWISPATAAPIAGIVTGVFEAGDGGDMVTLTVFEPGQPPRPLPEAIRQGTTANTWCWPLNFQPLAQTPR
ncbi:hypothetical protein [Methylobacterium flocculans]|uniref:hypothetical protein n=1 Tax=Methylobacterium flocculans TaxID=2984843 RepID=UPI0021F31233|nr:hypothetical protein [Methylobacterium sp. FF17]